MATTIEPTEKGTAFLTTSVGENAAKIFTLEERDEEQRWIQESSATFVTREVLPRAEAIDRQEPGVLSGLLKQAGEQGLLMIDVPEQYGGAELGLLTSALVASELREASFSVAFGAHTTIGTLPIVYYGTEEQKQSYLPRLATGEWISAYALTEPGVGSDAMGITTRAELSEDGQHYIINGTKQWISNAGFADLFIVFARIGNERPSAFIVEATWEGVSTGPEEHKMGIKGSSTRQVYFEDVKVPVANLLGELNKGYKIAFNILNIGRLKLGAGSVGGARSALGLAATYTTERKAFGKFLHEFGMIKKKLARMAAETYAAESEVFRTAGNIAQAQKSAGANTEAVFKSIEEYAIEASLAKVHGSEVLAQVVDEGVQIFGGYGFMQEYPIEKAYRDARIQRIFEGTNEINRMVATGTLFKRALAGKVELMTKYPAIEARLKSGEPTSDLVDENIPEELRSAVAVLERAKEATIYASMQIALKHMQALENEQEFIEYQANLLIDLYAIDSALARAIKAVRSGVENSAIHIKLAQLASWLAFTRIRSNLDQMIIAYTDPERVEKVLSRTRSYVGDYLLNGVALQREIAQLVVEKQGYPL
ncbi:acyl-CoA dehydrogenase family protein [Tengunoibacter tsumagoiensis]|uniref:Acyl-CoA dehydrogenase n=1 Tax=Tengunoibacter tsumagoiensis TaxID=2014871 RepID=A0A401ZWD5_9CHLR|nr:acyl-CoA dehydrogenase family protein [Tengunoibacter tsumagoiensis]GCE11205.1 acyl-CoA dehydrogenase [Tengunoibacter tsumagoiensis]